jgi:hypothetical protein
MSIIDPSKSTRELGIGTCPLELIGDQVGCMVGDKVDKGMNNGDGEKLSLPSILGVTVTDAANQDGIFDGDSV